MEGEDKVFSSNIIRVNKKLNNNLYDVINIEPAKPLVENANTHDSCDFVPRNDKHYVPKKRNGVKVKTVRDIRNIFEKDVLSYLPADLEQQKNFFMRKIRAGSSKEDQTKQIAKNILKNESPVTRQVWQMIMNINPLDCKHPSQFVLWNGKHIQVSGSRGGKCKFISNYNIGKVNKGSFNKQINKRPFISKRRGLLQNSLNVKFKPGPLTKKTFLDTSNQRYQFGDMELVNLPKAGLDIQPSFGKYLTPSISTFIQNTFLFDTDETMSQKWVDFSVSVLGTIKNGVLAQINRDCITFDLDYKCQQHRLLMRHDSDKTNIFSDDICMEQRTEDETTILSEVKSIMENILGSVEISLNQDTMYSLEDVPWDNSNKIDEKSFTKNQSKHSNTKDKPKRKCNELNRLDVTVITIPRTSEPSQSDKCSNAFCALGCVCESLKCSFNLNRHCGRLECMFNCKCDFSKYNLMDTIDNDCSDILPGLVNLDKKLGLKLAKEEQKFHQTVILTEDKSIHLKSRKRNWKTSKKYADFYSTMRLKDKINGKRVVTIECVNLDCKNIEPWCMVHNLYKCFCKGKFTETSDHNAENLEISIKETDHANPLTSIGSNDNVVAVNDFEIESNNLLKEERRDTPKSFRNESENKIVLDIGNYTNDTCARLISYVGRKYNDIYYKNANQKILEMERNDKKIQKRLSALLSKDDKTKISPDESDTIKVSNTNENEQKTISTPGVSINPSNITNMTSNLGELLRNVIETTAEESSSSVTTTEVPNNTNKPVEKRLPTKSKLVAWLESSYKQYKQTPEANLVKLSLEPPKNGKVALYSWEFILSRYREKKNYFLLTKQKPYRIFMAVDIKNVFFENCINISNIPLSEIDKYPITVKNLLTNATNLKDNFCILHGLSFCWEFVGSVAKVQERIDSNDTYENKDETSTVIDVDKYSETKSGLVTDANSDNTPIVDDSDMESDRSLTSREEFKNPQPEKSAELSKWFLMTLVNDFIEIRFYKKGFFVKYDSIIKAINVARISGKTVRLSSQKCNTAQNDPQFGIYAVPSKESYCVFIGPYEDNERLGIETVKNTASRRIKESTRGIWITTNKVDNIKVIDNPLLYLPSHDLENDKMVTLESYSKAVNTSNDTEIAPIVQIECEVVKEEIPVKKVIKPIKIKKGGICHLSSSRILRNSSEQLPKQIKKNVKTIVLNKSMIISPKKSVSLPSCNSKSSNEFILLSEKIKELNKTTESKPIAEIAPQIKESNRDKIPETPKRKFEGGMYVLKPEEINMKSWENTQLFDQPQSSSHNVDADDMDVENFIAKSVVRTKNFVYIISDDDDEDSTPTESCNNNVWIVCKNVEQLGWIPGKKDHRNKLSFEFPGFKYTDYYPQEEAFKKINQVLSRKVYVPKNIDLEWCYVESETEVKGKNKLSSDDLCSDFIMTKKGLRHKFKVMEKYKNVNSVQQASKSSDEYDTDDVDKKLRAMSDLEETSSALEEESSYLMDEIMKKLN